MNAPRHPTVVRRRRDSRLAELASVGPFVNARLSLVEVKCGEPTCHCATGKGHPAQYLIFMQGRKTRSRYVQKDRLGEAREWVREYKRLKRLIREISDLTLELLASDAYVRRQQKRRRQRS